MENKDEKKTHGNKGRKRPDLVLRNRVNKWNLGKKMSEESRKRLSASLTGRKMPFRPRSQEWKDKMSEITKRRILGEKQLDALARGRKKIATQNTGRILPPEWRENISKAHRKLVQEGKCHLWKGGITDSNKLLRTSTQYAWWRKAVFKRDDYTCRMCGQRGGKLQADHIKPFSLFPELRLALDNGRTLCVSCHKTTDTYAGRVFSYNITT